MQQCCCICLDMIDKEHTNHDFACCKGKMHKTCFQLFSKSKTRYKCPYCRGKLTKNTKINKTQNIYYTVEANNGVNMELSILDYMI